MGEGLGKRQSTSRPADQNTNKRHLQWASSNLEYKLYKCIKWVVYKPAVAAMVWFRQVCLNTRINLVETAIKSTSGQFRQSLLAILTPSNWVCCKRWILDHCKKACEDSTASFPFILFQSNAVFSWNYSCIEHAWNPIFNIGLCSSQNDNVKRALWLLKSRTTRPCV